MDLSKAFDTMNHELLIAKLYTYGFPKDTLKLSFSYMSDRWQKCRSINLLIPGLRYCKGCHKDLF